MTARSKVAVLYTTPETVLQDYQRLFELAGGAAALQPGAGASGWHSGAVAANAGKAAAVGAGKGLAAALPGVLTAWVSYALFLIGARFLAASDAAAPVQAGGCRRGRRSSAVSADPVAWRAAARQQLTF